MEVPGPDPGPGLGPENESVLQNFSALRTDRLLYIREVALLFLFCQFKK